MISVIIPIYNSSQYLLRSIETVFNQTYTDLDLILVDDGYTDGSGDLYDEFAKIVLITLAIH